MFYKTDKMKKPKFVGLGKQNIDEFMNQFTTPADLKTWTLNQKPKSYKKTKS